MRAIGAIASLILTPTARRPPDRRLRFDSAIAALNYAVTNVATARRIILSMPEAEERRHHGHPDFRVNNKIFATLWPKESRVVVKLSMADQTAYLKSSPLTFSTNAWSGQGWTNVQLKSVSADRFRELVEDSWRKIAPTRLVAEHDANKESNQ
jgi:hypothetical protein